MAVTAGDLPPSGVWSQLGSGSGCRASALSGGPWTGVSRIGCNRVSERQWLFGTLNTWQITLYGNIRWVAPAHGDSRQRREVPVVLDGRGSRVLLLPLASTAGLQAATRTLVGRGLRCSWGAPSPCGRAFSPPVLTLLSDEIVALKRLKMEKEKEGFPITSLREINTILKAQHPNIVTVRVRRPRGQARQSSRLAGPRCLQSLPGVLGLLGEPVVTGRPCCRL